MVVALGPGKFYGSSLPRPRIYTDVKFNDRRVDPPVPVLDPLMSWAEEAHWSMGGLNFTRLRLQGRIEGSIQKLRTQHDRSVKERNKQQAEINHIEKPKSVKRSSPSPSPSLSPSPPPAPVAVKRRRFLVDEEEEESGGEERQAVKRGPARKLWDDFDKVAEECGMKREVSEQEGVATRTRSQKTVNVDQAKSKGKKKLKKKNGENGVRVSPRLAKRG